MRLKTLTKYSVNFQSRWIPIAGFFIGLSFFLLAVKYFGIENLSTLNPGEITISLIFPMLIMTVFGVSLCGFKFRAAPLYGIICSMYSLLLVFQAVSNEAGGILAVIWYILLALIALATGFGFLPSCVFLFLMCLLPAVYRLCFVDPAVYFQTKDWVGFLPEAAAVCGLLAFSALALSLRKKRK